MQTLNILLDLMVADEKMIYVLVSKIHRTPVECRFIVASTHCNVKPLTKTIFVIFELIYGTKYSRVDQVKFVEASL